MCDMTIPPVVIARPVEPDTPLVCLVRAAV